MSHDQKYVLEFFCALAFVIGMGYIAPLFCLLARFLGYPWRRRARF
jgi:hypothetical protein